MTDSALHVLATAAGLLRDWTDAQGRRRQLGDATLLRLLTALGLPADTTTQRARSLNALRDEQRRPPPLWAVDAGRATALPHDFTGDYLTLRDTAGNAHELALDGACWTPPAQPGYYTLQSGERQLAVAVAPSRCFTLADALGRDPPRAWGLAAQTYALRREGDGGVGDSSAAAQLAARIARQRGDALALSPLHALAPGVSSPYFPSHRGFLNWMLADPAQVLGTDMVRKAIADAGLADAWQAAEAAALIDWPAVSAMRHALWHGLHAMLPGLSMPLQDDLRDFVQRGGETLQVHARFTAEHAAAFGRPPGADGAAFERFAQWLAHRAWHKTAQGARDDGLGLGLIVDLAVGFDPAGSEAAANSDAVLGGLSLGAPPDAFNAGGQDWGITGYAPRALRRQGYAPFLAALRANMRLGGGLRIDHILGLSRLWVVPHGTGANDGGYLAYPLHDLLRLLALESWRHRCIVIGEDLGTVPSDLRATLAARGVLGIDVLLFNRDEDGAFLSPQRWRSSAVAMTTTHDLPPLAGWRKGSDLAWRARIDRRSDDAIASARQDRVRDVHALDAAVGEVMNAPAAPAGVDWPALRFTAASAAPLLLLPVEDALGLCEQPNLPGTTDEHPNWRRRLPADGLEAMAPAMEWIDHARGGKDTP